MATRKRWSEYTRGQRALIVTGAAVEVVLTTTALIDLARRPSELVRGPKPLWALGCMVQPFGPLAYLVLGRRSS
jgi:hypothetical protein